MRRVFSSLKKILSPLPLAMVMSFVLAFVVSFFGNRLQRGGFAPFKDQLIKDWTVRILIGIGLLLLLILILRAIRAFWANRKAKPKRESTIEEREADAMNGVFSAALDVIKKRWSGSERRIYHLPWYIVLGKQNAGKTSLIENSDLRFPIDHEISAETAQFAEYQAHSFLNWRVAGNEAVLLEIDGNQVIPHEDRDSVQKVLWTRLLDNLNKARPRRPLNGIIIAIDMTEFSGMTLSDREAYSLLIRRTIDDLVDRLGTQMTIHVAFTKLDQVAGFLDFFENLNGTEREELFGFHFLYEGKHNKDWQEQFDTQYESFLENLHLRTLKRLGQLKATASRQEAFGFYRTFLGLGAPLRSFLDGALGGDKFSTPPLIRGIYFMSSRQENPPRNTFLTAIGQRYHLPAPLYGVPQGNSFPYFVTRFIKEGVITEAGLAGDNLHMEARYRRLAMAVGLVGLIGTGGAATYWWGQYNENLDRASTVLAKAEEFNGVVGTELDSTGASLLDPMRSIREATWTFGDYRNVSATTATLTLYKGHVIGPIADQTYSGLLQDRFMPRLTAGIGQQLRDVCPRGGDEQLEYLRVYSMLGNSSGRDDRVIDKYFRDLWQDSFEADAETQIALQEHLTYALEEIPQDYEIDEDLFRASQIELGRLTPFRRVYTSLRSLAERQLPNALEFRSMVGAGFDIVYEDRNVTVAARQDTVETAQYETDEYGCVIVSGTDTVVGSFEISRLFTAEQFQDFFVPQVDQVARVAADDLWVLGIEEDTSYSEEDYDAIAQNIRELYVDDYVTTWRSALNSLEVRDFGDIRDASEILRSISGSDAPIRRLAELVRANTQIFDPEVQVLEGDEAASTVLPQDPNRRAGLAISESFAEIHRMLDSEVEGTRPNIDQIQLALVGVYDYLKTIRDAPRPNEMALEMAIARATLRDDDPIYVLERIAARTPAPFGAHLEKIADESWRIVMDMATQELNRKWHEEIYGDYQRLIAGKYPFDRESDVDLPLEDFQSFFQPGGILESFYQDELLTFVDGRTGEPLVIDGQSLVVDPDFAGALRSAIEISQAFFNEEGELQVEFTIQPVGMSANLARALINIEGQMVVSSHSASRPVRIIWPNILDGQRTSRFDISPLIGAGVTASRQYDGPWSWLRMYDEATKQGIENNAVDLSFANANGQSAIFRLRSEGKVNPFFNSPLTGFVLPSHMRLQDTEPEVVETGISE